MSDMAQGPGWWLASDGRWYPPELWTGPPNTGPPPVPVNPAQTPAHGAAGAVPQGQPVYGQYAASSQYTPYGQGASAYAYGPSVQQKTNGLAIASLICACAGLFLIPAILGVVFGFVARTQIKRSNGLQKGDGLAIAGIIVGFGWLALLVLGIALGASTDNNNGVIGPAALMGQLGLGGAFS
jgi:Domain of unknown function (DUF4190)